MSIAEVTDQYNEEEGYYYEQGQDYDAETDLPAQATETDERYPPQATNTTNEQEEEEEEGLVKEDVKKEDDSTDIIPNMLFVSRFKHGSTTKEHVQELFAPYGPIKNIIVREKLAFVEYVAPEDAAKAKHAIHYGAGLGSDSLIVDFKKANGFVVSEKCILTSGPTN